MRRVACGPVASMYPPFVVPRLLEGEKQLVCEVPGAAVFFSDIHRFTSASTDPSAYVVSAHVLPRVVWTPFLPPFALQPDLSNLSPLARCDFFGYGVRSLGMVILYADNNSCSFAKTMAQNGPKNGRSGHNGRKCNNGGGKGR